MVRKALGPLNSVESVTFWQSAEIRGLNLVDQRDTHFSFKSAIYVFGNHATRVWQWHCQDEFHVWNFCVISIRMPGVNMKKLILLSFMLPVLSLAAGKSTIQPDAWDAQMKLREAVDTNPDPHIVEVNLEASVASVVYGPHQQVEAWTYNGDIPGPLIRVHVGDRLIVHFKNNLPKPTTVHWHGMRVPIEMDGVPGISQPEVQLGGSFTYDFIAPDAGLYWYHPHVMSAMQVSFGLYGAVLVEGPDEDVGVSDELVLVLSDIGIEDSGALLDPESAGGARMVFGLEGNHVLVNGRERPKLIARAGAPQRWRIVNAAKARYFELELTGAANTGALFTVIGRDGGLQEYATEQETLVVAPGERMDVIVTPKGTPGSDITVRSLPHNRGYGSEYLNVEDLFTIALANASPYSAPARLPVKRSIKPLDGTGATPINMDITLVQVNERTIEYRINNVPPAKLVPVQARIGETQIWTITNQTKWSHPIHLHGFFFQVLDKNGDLVRPLAWRDTVDVPFEETMRFIVKYDDRPGTWMFHCHILDHAEGGVMGMVELGNGLHERHEHSSHAQ
jgi:FtsP/CotA-like multicopper oxidase with cupredoxin domain